MTDWMKLKVVDLKSECRERGLAQTGLKSQLVTRLIAAEAENAAESEPTVEEDETVKQPESVEPTSEALEDNQTAPESVDQGVKSQDDSSELPATKSPVDIVDSSKPQSQADDSKSPLPPVEPQEVAEDRQKRKRRSVTPPLSASESARKRIRTEENDGPLANDVVTTPNGPYSDRKHTGLDEADANALRREDAEAGSAGEPVDTGDKDVLEAAEGQHLTSEFEEGSPERERQRDSRYKDLFEAPQPVPTVEDANLRHPVYDVEDESHRAIDPAIHPATSALYIRDFMRPLNQLQLKSHLAALASPTAHEEDQDLVVNFYIDLIRTHAFVSFSNVSAAVRVRSALHGSVWPVERNRKPLWADFIPAEKVDEWINQEKSYQAGGRSMAKKWEVVYHNMDSDRPVEATLEEASDQPSGKPAVPMHSSTSGPPEIPDESPAREFERTPGEHSPAPRKALDPEPSAPSSFSTLDQLFNSTTTKPVLYWQPVSKSLANNRLGAIDSVTSKDTSRIVRGEINRYTFEDGDMLVDRGPEIFSGIRPPPGYRGGSARGGGTRGGFPGRGGRGGTYDSYRGDTRPRDDGRRDRRNTRDDRSYY